MGDCNKNPLKPSEKTSQNVFPTQICEKKNAQNQGNKTFLDFILEYTPPNAQMETLGGLLIIRIKIF